MTRGNSAGYGNAAKRVGTTEPGPWSRWKTTNRAARCIRFVETYCVLPKGYGAGKTVTLAPFQRDWLEAVLADDVSSAAMLVPRGNGKSTLLAGVALWALFDDDEHGAPQVPVVATTLNQAVRSVYGVAQSMRDRCELLAERSLVFSGTGTQRMVVPPTGGEMFPIASSVDGLQGLDPSLAVVDELGFIDVDAWDSLLLAGGKRPRSLVVGIGTPGFDRSSALWNLENRVLTGTTPRGFHLTVYRADPGCDVNDEEQWRKANPSLDAGYMNVDALRTAVDMSHEAHFRIFRLGQWIDGVTSWLGDDGRRVWDALCDPWPLQPKQATWAGVDIGLKRDSSAVVVCQERPDGRRHVVARIWTPAPDGRLDVTDVMAHLRDLSTRYGLQGVHYDPRFFDLPAQQLLDEGLPMVEMPQVLERMSPAIGSTFDAVKNGTLTHDADPLFDAHVLAAVPRFNERGFMLSKGRSKDAIDAAVAMAMAVHASLQPAAEPEPDGPYFYNLADFLDDDDDSTF